MRGGIQMSFASASARFVPRRALVFATMVSAVIGLSPAFTAAQDVSASGIGGFVSDESGSALPGVTISLTSPALQVAQINAVTDGTGQYRLAPLPPGVYQLRFELSGFQSVLRSDLQIGAGFVARVDMVLKIGA